MLSELATNINKIYFDKTISAILTDILSKCGGDYNYDFVPEGLRIYKVGDLVAYPEFRVAPNLGQLFSPYYKGNMSHSTSIDKMYNSIKVTSEKNSVYTELMVLQNRELSTSTASCRRWSKSIQKRKMSIQWHRRTLPSTVSSKRATALKS